MLKRVLMLNVVLLLSCDTEDNSNDIVDSGNPDQYNATVDGPPPVDTTADAGPVVPTCLSTITAQLTDVVVNAPGKNSDGYTPLSATAATELELGLKAMLAGDLKTAIARATTASYTLCQEADVVLWRSTETTGHAALAVRQEGTARPVIVGVPHPVFEPGTPQQGLQVFTQLKARALVIAGTHRCASKTPSSCDGTTGVCGASGAPYPISDAAHNVDMAFQIFHEQLLAQDKSLVAISLHGMAGDGISISDGTTDAVAADAPIAKIAPLLAKAFPGDTITSCNTGAGVPRQVRLCGTTNVQGRLANGASAPCTEAAASASGRFLHIEQSSAVRVQAALVVDALDQVL